MEPLIVQWLRDRYPLSDRLRVGIGDDAAILDLAAAPRAVVTTDMLMDGVDFEVDRCGPSRVGRKALAVNLSDLAAMAARPVAAVVSLALPRDGGMTLARQLYEGMLPLAEEFSLALVGGDTNSWRGSLVISLTAFTPRCSTIGPSML